MCTTFQVDETVSGRGKKALKVAEALSYSIFEVNQLYRNFLTMDIDGSGEVTKVKSIFWMNEG